MSKKEWKEKKTSLGNAIILSAVALVAGIFLGVNGQKWFSDFAPYLGLEQNHTSEMNWSELNEVYNKLESKEFLQKIEQDSDNNITVYIGDESGIENDVTVIKTKFKRIVFCIIIYK